MSSELDHTPPRPDCPHPEWWHAPDGQATEEEVTELVAAFVRATQPERVVETGTYKAHTTVAIARALERNGHGWLYSFETNTERATAAEEIMSQEYGSTSILGMPITDWEPPAPIDLAFIDSETDVRVDELNHLVVYASPGATFIFHDTRFDWADPIHDHPDLRCLYLATPRGVTIAQVGPKVTRQAHDWAEVAP